jgi:hypothetical protein
MTYELAKQLQEAGFPQDYKAGDSVFFQWRKNLDVWKSVVVTHHGSEHDDCGYGKCECECSVCYPHGNKNAIKIPTLSELIEACGETFGLLERDKNTGAWYCVSDIDTDGKTNAEGSYSAALTPEEAVAKLWLALKASAASEQPS